MPRLGEKFTFELSTEEQLGLKSVADPRRQDLVDRPPVSEQTATPSTPPPAAAAAASGPRQG